MNTPIRFAALMLLVVSVFITCKQTTTQAPVPTPPVVVAPQPAPTISSIKPDTGMAGMKITITGANLKAIQEVKFGSLTAVVTSSEMGKVMVTCPDFGSVQRVPVSVQTSSGTASGKSFTGAPALVIDKEKCIPAGLIPGAFVTLKGKNFSKVTQINFSNTTVASNQFTFNDGNGITLKVPANTQSGKIWMVNEYGSSQGVQFDLLTGGDGLNTSNIATNVPQLVTSVISDAGVSPFYFFYCMPFPKGSYYDSKYSGIHITVSRLEVAFKQKASRVEVNFYDSLKMGGDKWYQFKGYFETKIVDNRSGTTEFNAPYIKLMLERNSLNTGYTGSVIINISTINSDLPKSFDRYDLTYLGNMIKKTANKDLFDIVAYEVKTGEVIRLCNQACSDCQ